MAYTFFFQLQTLFYPSFFMAGIGNTYIPAGTSTPRLHYTVLKCLRPRARYSQMTHPSPFPSGPIWDAICLALIMTQPSPISLSLWDIAQPVWVFRVCLSWSSSKWRMSYSPVSLEEPQNFSLSVSWLEIWQDNNEIMILLLTSAEFQNLDKEPRGEFKTLEMPQGLNQEVHLHSYTN